MIYHPAEDSYLLEEQVRKYAKGKSVLDIGSGSGIQALRAKNSGAKSITASDIDEESIENLKKLGIKVVRSNLFKNIKRSFDLIIFNPPYLPLDSREDRDSRKATTGGKLGDELILKFIKEAKNHLNPGGIILLLVSSLTPQDKINKVIKSLKFKAEIISKKKLFMESLFVLKISF